MRKLIVILLVLTGCGEGGHFENGKNSNLIPDGNHCIDQFEYDGCEYIYIRRFASVAIEHKGNCKNHPH